MQKALLCGLLLIFSLLVIQLRILTSSCPENKKIISAVPSLVAPKLDVTPEKIQNLAYSPNEQPEKQKPAVGVVYYFHIPKTGGTHLEKCFDEMSKSTNEISQIKWNREGKSLAQIDQTLQQLSASNFNNQLTIIQHHHRYPSIIDTLPLILKHKELAESQGKTFDLIMTVRDTVDYIVSLYNYTIQSGYIHLQDVEVFISNQRNPILAAIFLQTPTTGIFEPWTLENDEYYNENTIKWLQKVYEVADQIDFIFTTSELDSRFPLYFEGKYGIPFVPLNYHGNAGEVRALRKENLDYQHLHSIYSNCAIEQLFLQYVHNKARKSKF